MPACPHCKSPARGNPCWWPVDQSGGDPPCAGDDYDEAISRDGRKVGITIGIFIAVIVAAMVLIGLFAS